MSKIKICGLSRTDDILSANEFVPDYAGFVFSKSKRCELSVRMRKTR